MNLIKIQDLTKIYLSGLRKASIVALDRAALEVRQGEIFGLLGPNGAGKTTLVKVLLGVVRATTGQALLNGLPPTNPESRRKVGFLPENHRFPAHLTGLGLLEFSGRLYGFSPEEIESQALPLLQTVGMDRWANVKIRRYSKGMLQRIGLAQAMMGNPDLLILDEPTDGVDPVGKAEIRQVLLKLRGEGKTILLNSHLLSEVESIADRVAILVKGRVVRVDTMEALTVRRSQYEIEAAIGDDVLDIPAEVGRKVFVSTDRLVVELRDENKINDVIDELRRRKIAIHSVKPLKITLEQSFFETLAEDRTSGGA
ncbi:MAG TPA: ABC transporter ATP-binding protein [Candidatus Acidoferrum sp.]|nr:ABC transporter ATP-binding protein [Candidatus Acidoferrum sp.]